MILIQNGRRFIAHSPTISISGEECDRARKAAQKASLEASMEPSKAGSSRGPMVGPQIETPNSFLRAVKKAPTSGTRWHNPPGTKKWNEAQTEEGHIYYWNIDTNGKKIFFKVNIL